MADDGMSPLFDSEIRRIDEVEEMMSTGIQTRRVAPLVARKFGITRRHAQRYVRAVIERWKHESERDREDKRAQLEATLWGLYRAALRRKTVYVQRGKTPADDRVVEKPDPDIRGGHDVLRTLGLMHGIIGPDKLEITVGGTVETRVMAVIAKAYGLEAGPVVEGEEEPVQLPAGEESEP